MRLRSQESDVGDIGKVAYDAYWGHTGGKSLATGDDLPMWENLPLEIQDAWRVAADAVLAVS